MLAQYKQVEKVTGKTPQRLKEYRNNDIPRRFRYLLDYFYDACTNSEYSHSELLSWTQVKLIKLKGWELDAIKAMWLERDRCNNEHAIAQMKSNAPKKK